MNEDRLFWFPFLGKNSHPLLSQLYFSPTQLSYKLQSRASADTVHTFPRSVPGTQPSDVCGTENLSPMKHFTQPTVKCWTMENSFQILPQKARKLKVLTQMPINSWRNKMWCIPIVEYHYSAIKRSGILTQATAWMSLENMLSEVKQTQKVKYRESAYVKLLE